MIPESRMTIGEAIIREIGIQEMFTIQPTDDGYAVVWSHTAEDQLCALVEDFKRRAEITTDDR